MPEALGLGRQIRETLKYLGPSTTTAGSGSWDLPVRWVSQSKREGTMAFSLANNPTRLPDSPPKASTPPQNLRQIYAKSSEGQGNTATLYTTQKGEKNGAE